MEVPHNGICSTAPEAAASETPESVTGTSGSQRHFLSLKNMDNKVFSGFLSQTRPLVFEVLDDASPRHFIIVPSARSSRKGPMDTFFKPFKLHFLCECGLHKSQQEDAHTISDAMHLTDHPGYWLQRPTEFFKKCTPLMSALAKNTESMAQVTLILSAVIPMFSPYAYMTEAFGTLLREKIERYDAYGEEDVKCLVDEAIESLAKTTPGDNGKKPKVDCGHSTLEGSIEVEVVKLKEFGDLISLLDKADSESPVNLYRTVTREGCPLWVCQAHLWQVHPEDAQNRFIRFVRNSGGSFEEMQGKLTIKLNSPFEAQEFYDNLFHDDRVRILEVYFRWVTTRSDLQELTKAILKSPTIFSLHLNSRPHTLETFARTAANISARTMATMSPLTMAIMFIQTVAIVPVEALVKISARNVARLSAKTVANTPERSSAKMSAKPTGKTKMATLTLFEIPDIHALINEISERHQIYAPILQLLAEGPIETIEIQSAEFLDCLRNLSTIPWIPNLETLGIHEIHTDKRKRLFLQLLKRCPSLHTLPLSDVLLAVPSLEVCPGLRVLILHQDIFTSSRDLKATLDKAVALLKARKTTLQILIRSSLTTSDKDQVSITLSEGGISAISTNLRDDESLKSVIEGHGWTSSITVSHEREDPPFLL
ncbi:hypothetical protein EMPS_09400 [Entomortierella parvispora]|uniref:Uncharacterized protein n=1 Tax=Entomortierella parvispora TaxID=205924 RepID=A0A9P3HI56_9FUNG|nr:hypothetical protein EMPS_09400 [Entomortierella parvispora]